MHGNRPHKAGRTPGPGSDVQEGTAEGGVGVGVARTAANLAGTKVKEPGRLEVQQQFRGKLSSLNVFTPNGKLLQIKVGDFALNGNVSKNQRSNYHLITRSVQGSAVFKPGKGGIPRLKGERESAHAPGLHPASAWVLRHMQQLPEEIIETLSPDREVADEILKVLEAHPRFKPGGELKTARYL